MRSVGALKGAVDALHFKKAVVSNSKVCGLSLGWFVTLAFLVE